MTKALREKFAALKLLIVDDDPTMRSAMLTALRAAGMRDIVGVGSGEKGLAAVQSNRIDIIVCDYHMENMDGLGFVTRLRQSAWGANTPVIMLTANSEGENAYRARELAVAAWLVKPIQPNTLVRHVAATLGLVAPQVDDNNLEDLAAAYEAQLPAELSALAATTAGIADGRLSFDAFQNDLLTRLHNLKGQAGMLGYGLLGHIAGWMHDLQRIAVRQHDMVAHMQPELIKVLRVGAAVMQMIGDHKLRGDGGDAGVRIRAQFGPAAEALLTRFADAVAAANAGTRAHANTQAELRVQANVDREMRQRQMNTYLRG